MKEELLEGIQYRQELGYKVIAIGVNITEYWSDVFESSYVYTSNHYTMQIGYIFGIPLFSSNSTMYCVEV